MTRREMRSGRIDRPVMNSVKIGTGVIFLKKAGFLCLLLCCVCLLTACSEVMEVEEAISQIGSVSMDAVERIEHAERLYAALPGEQKKNVDNYYTLYSAREEYDRMCLRILEGIYVIDCIGEITTDSGDRILQAREKYVELEALALAEYVTNSAALDEAEVQYTNLLLEEAEKLLKNRKYQEAYDAYEEIMTYFPHCEAFSDAWEGEMTAAIGLAQKQYSSGALEECMEALQNFAARYGETEESAALLQKLEKQLENQRPKNGKVLQNTVNWGYSEFTVSASNRDACIKLESLTDPARYVLFYVRRGESATVKVQDGAYVAKYTTGDHWFNQSSMFGKDAAFVKADDIMEFETTYEGQSVYYSTIAITLYQVAGGNMTTSEIDAESF